MRRETLRLVAVTVVILFAGQWACRSTRQNVNKPVEGAGPAAQPVRQSPFEIVDSKLIKIVSRFDHDRKEHKTKTQDCAGCHERPSNDPKPVVPSHSACSECHAKDFSNSESKMCVVCHKTPPINASLIAFPARLTQFGLKRFSHRDHMNPEKMKGQMDPEKMPDGAVKCDFCHRFDRDGLKTGMPKHFDCYACHIHQPGEKSAGCGACHIKKSDGMPSAVTRGTASNLYNFRHRSHLKKAACDKCHQTVEAPVDKARPDILAINTARGQRHHSTCWNCHVQAKESVCSKCHISALPF